MSTNNSYICFNLGPQEYGVPLLSIKEVLAMPELTPVPQSPSHFLGIMNLRGQVISVMDLRIKIGLKAASTEETAVMIVDFGNYLLGVVVDKINSVIAINEKDISEKPHIEATKAADYIQNIYRNKSQLVLLISIEKALSLTDLNLLNTKQAKAA
jgi:purine-binding chemotaxis protein CheW